MSKRLEYTIKGFIIGALIDYGLQIVFRLIFYVYSAILIWLSTTAADSHSQL